MHHVCSTSITDCSTDRIPLSPEAQQALETQAGLTLQAIAYPEDPSYLRHYIDGLKTRCEATAQENITLKQELSAIKRVFLKALQADPPTAPDWLTELSYFHSDAGAV